jgi:hypothetical protein
VCHLPQHDTKGALMITVTAFGFPNIPANERWATQFARDLVVLLNGVADSAILPVKTNRLIVSRVGPDQFTARIPYADPDKWPPKELSGADVAREALKFANATPTPQKKIVDALTKHLPREGALF